MANLQRGSQWNRWDLHFHTPSSFDYEITSVTDEEIVEGLVAAGVRVVAITDHHCIDVGRIRRLQLLGKDRLTVLPGIELRADQGSPPIHYICIFPETSDLDYIWTTFQGSLGLTRVDIDREGGDERISVPIEKASPLARKLGGLVTIHAGRKTNSIDNIKNHEQFLQQIKYNILSEHVDCLEIGQIKDIKDHIEVVFPHTKLNKPLLMCSDNHNIRSYSTKENLWLCADPTFRGLMMVVQEPRDRAYIGPRPPALVRVEQNKTKYVRRVAFSRKDSSAADQWFSGDIEFNHGLVAIIGNKGSGKSALADTLGLLGATKKSGSFSFLNERRFRHATNGYANLYEATLEWESGDIVKKCLADDVSADEAERIKYLPQDHVERVCNEIAVGEEGFEQELKAVIFSHVPDTERLGQKTLDDLVRFRTSEKQKRIDTLQKQLLEISRNRALLEGKTAPSVRRELESKIERRKAEISSHDEAKPKEARDPASDSQGSTGDPVLLGQVRAVEEQRREFSEEISKATSELTAAQRRLVIANRVLEKLDNFEKDFEAFRQDLRADADELKLDIHTLAVVNINRADVVSIRDRTSEGIEEVKSRLDGTEPEGLRKRKETADQELLKLQSQLDAPNKAYQDYLKALEDWQARREEITGTDQDPDSLTGLEASLKNLDAIPQQIDELRLKQSDVARSIHREKLEQVEVYQDLYKPVQKFIDSHELAKDKLKLEFRAELVEVDFAKNFLSYLAQNRRGSFMGLDEGRARVDELTQLTIWNDTESVAGGGFLKAVDHALHVDVRENNPPPMLLQNQLVGGKKSEDMFNFLYGLGYVRPRYVLRWEGKDLSMLSPGERGTLLLVFYLLIDKGDMPLVIDQPEGNLDNHTVAKMLVDCIKEARKRRQVFIVTHNPNLAVVCDADQVIHASMDKEAGFLVTYTSGALENETMSQFITDVLEGTRWAFGVRGGKYEVAVL